MKKILLGFLALVSVSSFAQSTLEQTDTVVIRVSSDSDQGCRSEFNTMMAKLEKANKVVLGVKQCIQDSNENHTALIYYLKY